MTPRVKSNGYDISRIMLLLYIVISTTIILVALLKEIGFKEFYLGFTIGTIGSIFNFYLLNNGIKKMLGAGSRGVKRRGYIMFVMRYFFLLSLINYAVKHPQYLNVFLMTLGLLMVQIALFISALKTNLYIRK